MILATMAACTFLVYAGKDLAPPRVRGASEALYWLAMFACGGWVGYGMRGTPVDPEDAARARERFEAQLTRAIERKQAGQPPEPGAFALDQRTREKWKANGKPLALQCAVTMGERLLVAGLRRSSLRYPNVVAGLILATTRTTMGALRLERRALPG